MEEEMSDLDLLNAVDEDLDDVTDEDVDALLNALFGVVAIHPDEEPTLVGSYLTESAMRTAANAFQSAHPEAQVLVRHNPDTDEFDVAAENVADAPTDPSVGVRPGVPIADFATEELALAYIDAMSKAGIDTSAWRIVVADPWCTYVYAS
jgi:hypothetical protein